MFVTFTFLLLRLQRDHFVTLTWGGGNSSLADGWKKPGRTQTEENYSREPSYRSMQLVYYGQIYHSIAFHSSLGALRVMNHTGAPLIRLDYPKLETMTEFNFFYSPLGFIYLSMALITVSCTTHECTLLPWLVGEVSLQDPFITGLLS